MLEKMSEELMRTGLKADSDFAIKVDRYRINRGSDIPLPFGMRIDRKPLALDEGIYSPEFMQAVRNVALSLDDGMEILRLNSHSDEASPEWIDLYDSLSPAQKKILTRTVRTTRDKIIKEIRKTLNPGEALPNLTVFDFRNVDQDIFQGRISETPSTRFIANAFKPAPQTTAISQVKT